MTTKERMKKLIEEQPDDATHEEILRELAFARMVDRGLADAREGRMISNEECRLCAATQWSGKRGKRISL